MPLREADNSVPRTTAPRQERARSAETAAADQSAEIRIKGCRQSVSFHLAVTRNVTSVSDNNDRRPIVVFVTALFSAAVAVRLCDQQLVLIDLFDLWSALFGTKAIGRIDRIEH